MPARPQGLTNVLQRTKTYHNVPMKNATHTAGTEHTDAKMCVFLVFYVMCIAEHYAHRRHRAALTFQIALPL